MKSRFLFLSLVMAIGFALNTYAQSSPAGGNWNESDGADDYAQAGDSASLDVADVSTENLTLEAWVYLRSFPPTPPGNFAVKRRMIAGKRDAYELFVATTNLFGNPGRGFGARLVTNTGNSQQITDLDFPLQLNQWYHVAMVYDSLGLYTVYVDGEQVIAGGIGFNLKNSSDPFILAGNPLPINDEYFDGRIDEVRVSDVVRYTSNFNTNVPGRFTPDENTRALWHWDEPVEATVFADVSGNSNTLTGFNGDHSLPVQFSSFTATVEDDGIRLKWRTESETNNLGFYIHRSQTKDGHYVRITPELIKGHGTTTEPHEYNFLDGTAEIGKTYYYYIEDIDFSGKTNRSHIIRVGPSTPEGKHLTKWGKIKMRGPK